MLIGKENQVPLPIRSKSAAPPSRVPWGLDTDVPPPFGRTGKRMTIEPVEAPQKSAGVGRRHVSPPNRAPIVHKRRTVPCPKEGNEAPARGTGKLCVRSRSHCCELSSRFFAEVFEDAASLHPTATGNNNNNNRAQSEKRVRSQAAPEWTRGSGNITAHDEAAPALPIPSTGKRRDPSPKQSEVYDVSPTLKSKSRAAPHGDTGVIPVFLQENRPRAAGTTKRGPEEVFRPSIRPKSRCSLVPLLNELPPRKPLSNGRILANTLKQSTIFAPSDSIPPPPAERPGKRQVRPFSAIVEDGAGTRQRGRKRVVCATAVKSAW